MELQVLLIVAHFASRPSVLHRTVQRVADGVGIRYAGVIGVRQAGKHTPVRAMYKCGIGWFHGGKTCNFGGITSEA